MDWLRFCKAQNNPEIQWAETFLSCGLVDSTRNYYRYCPCSKVIPGWADCGRIATQGERRDRLEIVHRPNERLVHGRSRL